MTKAPLDNASSARGAQMGRGWIMPMDPALAETIVRMYAADPPKTDTEHRHLQVAQAAIENLPVASKCSLRRIRLNSSGYDDGGAYWGIGTPLYWAGSDDGVIDMWFRASSRGEAKDIICAKHPGVRFHR